MIYDIIIIGAGMAGLYCAYQIRQSNPKLKVLILEKNDKEMIGGRAGSRQFYGSTVLIGAGIGRFNKDNLLLHLLKEFGFPINKFIAKSGESCDLQGKCFLKKNFLLLKKIYISRRKVGNCIRETFRDFALPILGEVDYKYFVACSGYTDFEKSDVYDVFYHYSFDDNYDNFIGFGVPWKKLVEKMVSAISPIKIKTSNSVSKISRDKEGKYILRVDELNKNYNTNKVVIATTIQSIMKLIGSQFPIYKQIHGQPFLRCYGKFSKSSIPILKQYLTVTTMVGTGPFHKVISINPDKGIYMFIYSCNDDALYLKKYMNNTEKNRDFLCRILEKTFCIKNGLLKMLSMVSFFWDIGTHYYDPLTGPYKNRIEFIKAAQHPEDNLFVIGEVVGLDQGWTNTALQSVVNIEKKLLN